MEPNKRDKTKTVIIILAVLLALSLIALAGTLIYNRLAVHTDTTVTVPDNLITPDEDTTQKTSTDVGNGRDNKKAATAIALYYKNPQDNITFSAVNMFPGDVITGYYGVQVSYHDKVSVNFRADIRKGYEKLAEVMKVRVTLLGSDEVVYDGFMCDMPDSVTCTFTSQGSTTKEFYYEITAYLDTSVGNEYQNRDLVADFRWWVDENGNLDKAPQTGDGNRIVLWSVVAMVSLFALLIFLIFRRKKEGQPNG